MPASAATAAARRIRPRNIFAAGIPRHAARTGEALGGKGADRSRIGCEAWRLFGRARARMCPQGGEPCNSRAPLAPRVFPVRTGAVSRPRRRACKRTCTRVRARMRPQGERSRPSGEWLEPGIDREGSARPPR